MTATSPSNACATSVPRAANGFVRPVSPRLPNLNALPSLGRRPSRLPRWPAGRRPVKLGPNVHAVLTIRNKELGLSHGKSVKLPGTLFPELRIARATSVRSTLRTAGRCRPAYEQLGCDLRGASEVAPDETGCVFRAAWLGRTPSSAVARRIT